MSNVHSGCCALVARLRMLAVMLAFLLMLPSCGVLRFPNHPRYRAGEANPTGYTPEGTLREVVYNCSVKGPSTRRMLVYLPKGYADSDARYPVVYLFHGARGYETSWIKKGGVLKITDSLFREGHARPSILVMTNMNQYRNDRDYDQARFKDSFESLLEIDGTVESSFMTDVVSRVDSLFRTIPDKEHRAVAGLSIGGLQSMYMSANNPYSFGYVGLFSPVYWIIPKAGPYKGFYGYLTGKQGVQFSAGNEPLGYYVYVGRGDIIYPQVKAFRKHMDSLGFPYEYTETGGGHDWPNWRAYYEDMMGRIFTDGQD